MIKLARYILSLSIHTKFAVIIFFIITFISLSTALIALNVANNQTRQIVDELVDSNIKTNQQFLIASLFAGDSWKLFKYVKSLSQNQAIESAGILDKNNKILAHSNSKEFRLGSGFELKPEYKIIPIISNNIELGKIILKTEYSTINEMIKHTFVSNFYFIILAAIFSFFIANIFTKKLLKRFALVVNNMEAISQKKWERIKEDESLDKDEISSMIKQSNYLMNEIKQSLEKEEKLRYFYHNILYSIDSLIIICDHRMQLSYHNNHLLKKYVLDEKSISFLPSIIKEFEEQKAETLTIKLENEKVRFLFVNIHYINDKVVISFSDITKIKEVEENEKIMHSLEVLGEISSQFAHEIKNLLQPLTLLIPKTQVPDKEDLPIIHTTLSKMRQQVADFLFLGKPIELMDTKVENLPLMLDEILDILSTKQKDKKLKIQVSMDKNLEVYLNKKYLELILINLLTNAIEASFEKEIISVSWEDLHNGFTLLTVQNTGEEIKDTQKIFKPFYTTKKDGSGLGLFSLYKIIYTAKGKIEVTSKDNLTTFKIFIPTRTNR